jgi:putative transposase
VSTVKDTAFVKACLTMALWRRDHSGRPVAVGLIHHSDAGSQYTSIRFTETVALAGLVASIGSVGGAYDNVAAETVMGLFKSEAIRKGSPFHPSVLKGLPDVEAVTFAWVDWYNTSRPHSTIGNIPPDQFGTDYYTQETGPSADVAVRNEAA